MSIINVLITHSQTFDLGCVYYTKCISSHILYLKFNLSMFWCYFIQIQYVVQFIFYSIMLCDQWYLQKFQIEDILWNSKFYGRCNPMI